MRDWPDQRIRVWICILQELLQYPHDEAIAFIRPVSTPSYLHMVRINTFDSLDLRQTELRRKIADYLDLST